MQIVQELLPGCFVLQAQHGADARGHFVKTYHQDRFAALGLPLVPAEAFHSLSLRHVIRGMHFQRPPHAHAKLVYCTQGRVLDVLLDLRRGPHHGRSASVVLAAEQPLLVYIPKGIAHGFMAQSEQALMHYMTSTVHAPEADCGIRWDSFGFDWGLPAGVAPLLSPRDQAHPTLADFDSPF